MEATQEVVQEEVRPVESYLKVKGFFHLQLEEDGKIVGDSGRIKNLVTRHGFQHICLRVGTGLTGTQFSHFALGEGTSPATNSTALQSEVSGTNNAVQRQTATAATQAGSVTLRFTGTMSSANSFVTAQESIQNVGIYNHSSGSSLCAGAQYTSSTCDTNQNVNITYDLVFETA